MRLKGTNKHKREVEFIGTLLLILLCVPITCTKRSFQEGVELSKQVNDLYDQGRYQEAIIPAKRVLLMREKALGSEHPGLAVHLNNLAIVYDALGDYSKAEALHKRALVIKEKAFGPEHPEVAATLSNLGGLYGMSGNYFKGEQVLKRALAISEKAVGPEHLDVAHSLYNLANIYTNLADYENAVRFYERGLAISEKALGPEHPDVAFCIKGLADVYQDLGDYSKAEALHKRALGIKEKALGAEHSYVASSLNNLANLYITIGDYSKAEPLLKRALVIWEKALGPEHPKVAASLNNLANLYINIGNYSKAEPLYKRALVIWEKALGPEHPNMARSLHSLGNLCGEHGDYEKSLLLNDRALGILEKALGPNHPDVSGINKAIGVLYLKNGEIDKAFEIFKAHNYPEGRGACYLAKNNYKRALIEFQVAIKSKVEKNILITGHIGLGLAYEGMNSLSRAKHHFKAAIELMEGQWQTLALSARKNFLAGKLRVNFSRLYAYEGIVRVIIKEKKSGYQKEALFYAESVKSRTLLEMLAVKGAKSFYKESEEILARDRKFQQEVLMLKKRLKVLSELGPKAPEREIDAVEKRLEKSLEAYERFINEIKFHDSELASLITVEVSLIERIQSLLDNSTTILEYFTGKYRTYAWLITQDKVKAYELGVGEVKLCAMVNDLLLPNISNRSRRPEPIIMLSTGGTKAVENDVNEREENRKKFLKISEDLYKQLLAPLENNIHAKQLILVPHGVLHKVPFAALSDGREFMVEKYALSVVPSSSVIEYLGKKRNENKGRFVAFADPETDYIPLDFAEREVRDISKFFSKKELYFQREATEGKVKVCSNSPDIIHFACHGEFNDKQPMQSGLLLSKDDENDGFLQVHEIFGLDLRNANLVVLSACETALSKVYGGDDLVGLSRAFIYAGTPSLLATLWEVDDRSTSILIKEFYKNWHEKGLKKPEALRQAQLTVKSMKQYEHPFYWAPFVMIGDWSSDGLSSRAVGGLGQSNTSLLIQARLFEAQGKLLEALNTYEKILSISPDDEDAQEAYLRLRLRGVKDGTEEENLAENVSTTLERQSERASAEGSFDGPQVSGLTIETYKREVEHKFMSNWSYPVALSSPGKEEALEAIVVVKVRSDGRIVETSFKKKSPNVIFDESILEAVAESDPLPQFPPGHEAKIEEFEITFCLREFE